MIAGQGNDELTDGPGSDTFRCDSGRDTVTNFNNAEGDIASRDCDNV